MLDWLKKGAPYDAPGQARLRSLTVYPPNWRMVGVGSQVQLIAVGEYNDGSVRDLTSDVAFSSNIGAIASVKARRAGDGGAERVKRLSWRERWAVQRPCR